MRKRLVGGTLSKITMEDHVIHAVDGSITNNASNFITQIGDESGVIYEQYTPPPKVPPKVVEPNFLILHGKRIKKRNRQNTGPATDLLFGDYPPNEIGLTKLYNELYYEEMRESNNVNKAENLAKDRKEEVKEYLKQSDSELFELFRSKINNYAIGDLDNVTQDIVNRMQKNTGGYYSDKRINEAVSEHPSFGNFAVKVEESIRELVNSGKKIESFRTTLSEDPSNHPIYKKLVSKQVSSVKFNTLEDKFNGLTILINDVWAYEVYCKKYIIDKGFIFFEFNYRLFDHFGLDYPDLHKYDQTVFYVWFVLQHFRGYQPLVTEVNVKRTFAMRMPN